MLKTKKDIIKKPTEELKLLIDKALNSRLYIISQPGPTCFIIQGDNSDEQFKIIIGIQKCTCMIKEYKPCIHLLYIMLKVFHVDSNSSLLWSSSLSEIELNQVLYHRYASKKNNDSKRTSCLNSKINQNIETIRREADGDCPICLCDMSDDEIKEDLISYCKACGQNLHTKCMTVWARNSVMKGETTTCPLCRAEWKEEKKKVEIASKIWKCTDCNSKVGKRYRCNLDLCGICFKRDSHAYHSFVTTMDGFEWLPAIRSRETDLQKLRLYSELQNREITANDYDILRLLDRPNNMKLHDFLVDSLPNCIISNTQCCICEKYEKLPILKQLQCNHAAHSRCLTGILIFDVDAFCPIDNSTIFPGLNPVNLIKAKRLQVSAIPKVEEKIKEFDDEKIDFSFGIFGKNLSNEIESIRPTTNILTPSRDRSKIRKSSIIKINERPNENNLANSSSTLDLTIQSRSTTAPVEISAIKTKSLNLASTKNKQRSIGLLSKTLKSENTTHDFLLNGFQSRPICISDNSTNFSIEATSISSRPKSIGKISKGPSSRIRQALETESSISNFFIGNSCTHTK